MERTAKNTGTTQQRNQSAAGAPPANKGLPPLPLERWTLEQAKQHFKDLGLKESLTWAQSWKEHFDNFTKQKGNPLTDAVIDNLGADVLKDILLTDPRLQDMTLQQAERFLAKLDSDGTQKNALGYAKRNRNLFARMLKTWKGNPLLTQAVVGRLSALENLPRETVQGMGSGDYFSLFNKEGVLNEWQGMPRSSAENREFASVLLKPEGKPAISLEAKLAEFQRADHGSRKVAIAAQLYDETGAFLENQRPSSAADEPVRALHNNLEKILASLSNLAGLDMKQGEGTKEKLKGILQKASFRQHLDALWESMTPQQAEKALDSLHHMTLQQAERVFEKLGFEENVRDWVEKHESEFHVFREKNGNPLTDPAIRLLGAKSLMTYSPYHPFLLNMSLSQAKEFCKKLGSAKALAYVINHLDWYSDMRKKGGGNPLLTDKLLADLSSAGLLQEHYTGIRSAEFFALLNNKGEVNKWEDVPHSADELKNSGTLFTKPEKKKSWQNLAQLLESFWLADNRFTKLVIAAELYEEAQKHLKKYSKHAPSPGDQSVKSLMERMEKTLASMSHLEGIKNSEALNISKADADSLQSVLQKASIRQQERLASVTTNITDNDYYGESGDSTTDHSAGANRGAQGQVTDNPYYEGGDGTTDNSDTGWRSQLPQLGTKEDFANRVAGAGTDRKDLIADTLQDFWLAAQQPETRLEKALELHKLLESQINYRRQQDDTVPDIIAEMEKVKRVLFDEIWFTRSQVQGTDLARADKFLQEHQQPRPFHPHEISTYAVRPGEDNVPDEDTLSKNIKSDGVSRVKGNCYMIMGAQAGKAIWGYVVWSEVYNTWRLANRNRPVAFRLPVIFYSDTQEWHVHNNVGGRAGSPEQGQALNRLNELQQALTTIYKRHQQSPATRAGQKEVLDLIKNFFLAAGSGELASLVDMVLCHNAVTGIEDSHREKIIFAVVDEVTARVNTLGKLQQPETVITVLQDDAAGLAALADFVQSNGDPRTVAVALATDRPAQRALSEALARLASLPPSCEAQGNAWVLLNHVFPGTGEEAPYLNAVQLDADIRLRAQYGMASRRERSDAHSFQQQLNELPAALHWTPVDGLNIQDELLNADTGYYRLACGSRVLFVEKQAGGYRFYDPERGAILTLTHADNESPVALVARMQRLLQSLVQTDLTQTGTTSFDTSGVAVAPAEREDFQFQLSRLDSQRPLTQAAQSFLNQVRLFESERERLRRRLSFQAGEETLAWTELFDMGFRYQGVPIEASTDPATYKEWTLNQEQFEIWLYDLNNVIATETDDVGPIRLANEKLDKMERLLKGPFRAAGENFRKTRSGKSLGEGLRACNSVLNVKMQAMMLFGMLSDITVLSNRKSGPLTTEEILKLMRISLTAASLGPVLITLGLTGGLKLAGRSEMAEAASAWMNFSSRWLVRNGILQGGVSLQEMSVLRGLLQQGVRGAVNTLMKGLGGLSHWAGRGFILLSAIDIGMSASALSSATDPVEREQLATRIGFDTASTGLMIAGEVAGLLGIEVPWLLPVFFAMEGIERLVMGSLATREQLQRASKVINLSAAEEVRTWLSNVTGHPDWRVDIRTWLASQLKFAEKHLPLAEKYRDTHAKALPADWTWNESALPELRCHWSVFRGLSGQVMEIWEFNFLAMMAFLKEKGITAASKKSVQDLIEEEVDVQFEQVKFQFGARDPRRREKLNTLFNIWQAEHPELGLKRLSLPAGQGKTPLSGPFDADAATLDWSFIDRVGYNFKSMFNRYSATQSDLEYYGLYWDVEDPKFFTRWEYPAGEAKIEIDANSTQAPLPPRVVAQGRDTQPSPGTVSIAVNTVTQQPDRQIWITGRDDAENWISLRGQAPAEISLRGGKRAQNHFLLESVRLKGDILGGETAKDRLILTIASEEAGEATWQARLAQRDRQQAEGDEVWTPGAAGLQGAGQTLLLGKNIGHLAIQSSTRVSLTGNNEANQFSLRNGSARGLGGFDSYLVQQELDEAAGLSVVLQEQGIVATPGDNDAQVEASSIVIFQTRAPIQRLIACRLEEEQNGQWSLVLDTVVEQPSPPVKDGADGAAPQEVPKAPSTKSTRFCGLYQLAQDGQSLVRTHYWQVNFGHFMLSLPDSLHKTAQGSWEEPVLRAQRSQPYGKTITSASLKETGTLTLKGKTVRKLSSKIEVKTGEDAPVEETRILEVPVTFMTDSQAEIYSCWRALPDILEIGTSPETQAVIKSLGAGDRVTVTGNGSAHYDIEPVAALPDATASQSPAETGIERAGSVQNDVFFWQEALDSMDWKLDWDQSGALILSQTDPATQAKRRLVLRLLTPPDGAISIAFTGAQDTRAFLVADVAKRQAYLASSALEKQADGRFRLPADHTGLFELYAATGPLQLNTSMQAGDIQLVDKSGQNNRVRGASNARNLIRVEAGENSLWGGNHTDFITGGVGDDFISGEKGNDWLDGRTGKNHFMWRKGDGDDIFLDEGEDSLLLLKDVDPTTLRWASGADGTLLIKVGSEAVLSLKAPGDLTKGIRRVLTGQKQQGRWINTAIDVGLVRQALRESDSTQGLTFLVGDAPVRRVEISSGDEVTPPFLFRLPWKFEQMNLEYSGKDLLLSYWPEPQKQATILVKATETFGALGWLQDISGEIRVLERIRGEQGPQMRLYSQRQGEDVAQGEGSNIVATWLAPPESRLWTGTEANDRYLLPADGRRYRIEDTGGQDTLVLTLDNSDKVFVKRTGSSQQDLAISVRETKGTSDSLKTQVTVADQFTVAGNRSIERILVRSRASGYQYALEGEAIAALAESIAAFDSQSAGSVRPAFADGAQNTSFWRTVAGADTRII